MLDDKYSQEEAQERINELAASLYMELTRRIHVMNPRAFYVHVFNETQYFKEAAYKYQFLSDTRTSPVGFVTTIDSAIVGKHLVEVLPFTDVDAITDESRLFEDETFFQVVFHNLTKLDAPRRVLVCRDNEAARLNVLLELMFGDITPILYHTSESDYGYVKGL